MTHVESIQKWRFHHVDIPLDMTLEEVAARIGRFGRVAHRMGERGLNHFAGCVCPLRRPVPEARSEPMRRGGDAEFF